MRGRKPRPLTLSNADTPILEFIAHNRRLAWFQVQHARIVLAVAADHWRAPAHRPTATHQRVDEQAGLVDQDEVGLLSPDSFLIRDQSFFRQATMPSGLRCLARRAGFCGL